MKVATLDIKKTLIKYHSKASTLTIVNYIGDNPQRFKQLVTIFLEGPYRVTQRAAWPLSYCVQAHPSLINLHFAGILKMLHDDTVHGAVKRNILRLFQYAVLPKRFHGNLWMECMRLMSRNEPVAIRVFAMTVLSRIAREQPVLKRELRLLIEDELPFATPGFLARARKVLKELEK